MTVLDASALLAFLFRERGHDEVARVVEGALLSTVNLAEVLGRFARDGHDPERVRSRIEATNLEVVAFTGAPAARAAALVPVVAPYGLTLGDRACLALALERRLPAVTADRAWRELELGIEIRVVR